MDDIESILGIDPSLSNTGLCLLSLLDNLVIFDRIHYKLPFDKTYKGVLDRSFHVLQELEYFIKLYSPDIVIMESPLPAGQFAPGLSILSGVISSFLLQKYFCFFSIPPSFLRSLLGRYNSTKIVEFSRQIIEKEKMITSISRYSADEAVAFLLAYKLAHKMGGWKSENIKFHNDYEVFITKRDKCLIGNNLQRLKSNFQM